MTAIESIQLICIALPEFTHWGRYQCAMPLILLTSSFNQTLIYFSRHARSR